MSFHFSCHRNRLTADPFAHVDWPNAIDRGFYAELSANFPINQFDGVLAGDNRVHRLGSRQMLENPSTAACWRDLIGHLTSQSFWLELVDVFGDEFRRRHRHLEPQIGKSLMDWRVSRRGEVAGDIVLEALAVINTPVRTKPSHVKGPHIDTADKLWTGILYMRADDDDTPGGDLHFHRARGALLFDRHQIPRSKTEVAKTVPYEANRFVGFVNAPEAIHSVGPRPVTPHVRRYVDLVVELPAGKVFEAPQMRPLHRFAYRVSRQRELTR